MGIQYRPDNDRVLYDTASGNPMDSCCCPSCDDSVACHRFDACCDETLYSERITHPHFVVISDSKYTALGDPSCVVYEGCCYCDHDSTTPFPPNVAPAGVTASAYSSCDSCGANEGDSCGVCGFICNRCTNTPPRLINVTFSDIVMHAPNEKPQGMDGGILVMDMACHWNLAENGVDISAYDLLLSPYVGLDFLVSNYGGSGAHWRDTSFGPDTCFNAYVLQTTTPYGGWIASGTVVVSSV